MLRNNMYNSQVDNVVFFYIDACSSSCGVSLLASPDENPNFSTSSSMENLQYAVISAGNLCSLLVLICLLCLNNVDVNNA